MSGIRKWAGSVGVAVAIASNSHAITVQTVAVGNPGNLGDPVVMGDGTSGYGAVAYAFEIGKYEVTNAEYVAFLNAVAAADPNGLFSTDMSGSFNGGINRSGSSGSYVYAAKPGFAAKPVVYVSFFDAARFCNWLHNGQPVGPQGAGTTESGAYTLLGPTTIAPGNGNANGRTNTWLWALPTESEWHKAAFGNAGDTYTNYSTQSNIVPVSQPPPGGTNSANYNDAVSGGTDVGAYVQSVSFWGTFDQGGNVNEWNEGASFVRRIRGGNYDDGGNGLCHCERGGTSDGTFFNQKSGFRVVRAVVVTGACCLPDASCVEDVGPSACLSMRGLYQGHGSTCLASLCASYLGACCFADGDCADGLSAGQCQAAGGLFRGVGSTCAAANCSVVGPIVFVDAAAAPGGNGASWDLAISDLQDALDLVAAFPGAVSEIWIAAGQYDPGRGTTDRSSSFHLGNGVTLYGGFAGDESSLRQRDPLANPTILSGDLSGNDSYGVVPNATQDENCYRVVTASGVDGSAVLDGLTIQGGNGLSAQTQNQGGGAVFGDGGSPTIRGCTLTHNVGSFGGALYLRNGASGALIADCIFSHNVGGNGGAMYVDSQSPQVTDCAFDDNFSYASAGAVQLQAASPAFVNCSFTQNLATVNAGAVYGSPSSDLTVDGCQFTGNQGRSGGAILTVDSDPIITNCQFADNTTGNNSGGGGALALSGGSPTVTDCTFTANTASINDGGAMRITNGNVPGAAQVASCVFQQNSATRGGAVSNDGAISVVYVDCQFAGNNAATLGGGAYDEDFATVEFTDCQFSFNTALQAGGGLYHFNDGVVTLNGTTFRADAAPSGSGVFNHRGTLNGRPSLASGDGLVNGFNWRPGFGEPGPGAGLTSIDGSYRHAKLGTTGDQAPVMTLELAGATAGSEYNQVAANGGVQIDGGAIVLNFHDFRPGLGQSFDIITAPSVAGEFELVGVTGLPQGLSSELSYGSTFVRATIVRSNAPVYSSPPGTPISGLPTGAAVLDYDHDGFLDLALCVPAGVASQPGNLLVFRNLGNDPRDGWLGFSGNPIVQPAGAQPVAIVAGLLDADTFADIAVCNQSDGTVTVFKNLAGSGFQFVQNLPVGGAATSLGIGQLAGTAALDLAAVNKTAGKIRIFRNNGSAAFTTLPDINAGAGANTLALAQLNGIGFSDIVNTTSSPFLNPPSTLAVRLAATTGNPPFPTAVSYEIGQLPTGAATATLDDDALPDVICLQQADQALSILLNNPASPGALIIPAITLPMGGEPLSITSFDAEPDGDVDMAAVVHVPDTSMSALKLITNEPGSSGETQLSVNDIAGPESLALAIAADVDNDGDADLIAIAENGALADARSGAPSSSIQVLLNGPPPLVPGDVTGDGIVDIDDLFAVIGQWGPCPAQGRCTADLDQNGVVDIDDLFIVINNWS